MSVTLDGNAPTTTEPRTPPPPSGFVVPRGGAPSGTSAQPAAAGAAASARPTVVAQAPSGAPAARAGVRVNIFDLGVAPRPPQDPFSRGVRALADGIGHVVGELAGIPEGTPAQRDAPMVVHALSRAGFPVGPTGDVVLPNTREAGAFLADLVVQGHAPGDLALTPGVHGLLGFSDPQRLRQAGFGEAFVEGFRERSRAIANQGGVASATALFGLAGGVAGARNAPRPTTIVIEDGVPGGARPPAGGPRPPAGGLGGREPIRLVEVAPGHYARPETAGSGAIVPSPGGALARPGAGGALAPTSPGALGAATALPGAAASGPALAPSATGPLAPGRPADAGALHGPGNPEGIARMRAEAARREAALAADLDRRAAAIPVPRVADGADVTSGRVSWEAAGEAARAHNAGGDPLDVVVRVPVDRDYGDARRREVGLLRGDALQIQNQVSAMQASGRIPAGFDLPGAAAQAGVDWPGAVRAAADRRAYALAAEHPLVLNGGRTVAFPSRAAALAETAAFNRASSGADPVALYVPVNRTVGAGSARATGVAHEVHVGDPAALRATYRSLLDQGRVADGATFDEAIARSGVSGSLPGRAAASRDLRAAADEVRHPTTLFGSTVGVNPTPGEADAAAVAVNRQAGPGDPWALSVPLLRPVSGPGLPEGARGTAHAVYVNDPRYLRGFYDEMNRQGRIPDGVSFDDLLARSGVAGRYAERERARAAAEPPPARPDAAGPPSARTTPEASAPATDAAGAGGVAPPRTPPSSPAPAAPDPDDPPPHVLAARLGAARMVARDAIPELVGPAASALDDAQLDRIADVLGRRLATETDGTRPEMTRLLGEIARTPGAVDGALRAAGVPLHSAPQGAAAAAAAGAPLDPPSRLAPPVAAAAPGGDLVPRPQDGGRPRTIVPGVLDATTMPPVLDLGSLMPTARRVADEALPSVVGRDAVGALAPEDRASLRDALAQSLAAGPERTEQGMRDLARRLGENPAARAELLDVGRSLAARDVVDAAMADPALIGPDRLAGLSATDVGRVRAAIAQELVETTDGTTAAMRAALRDGLGEGGLVERALASPQSAAGGEPISLAQSLRVDLETFRGAIAYARNRIEATPDPALYPPFAPGLIEATPSRTLPLRGAITPREPNPDQPILNFVNEQVLGSPLVRAALKANGIDAVYLTEAGIRTGISGLGSQTRQFTEIDTAVRIVRQGLGDVVGAAARGDWNGVQAAVADFVRDLDRNSDQAFRPNRGTIAEVVQAPSVSQALQLGASMGPGLVSPDLPALPAEAGRSLFVELSAKNNLYDRGGTGGLVPVDPQDPASPLRVNVAYDAERERYVLLAPLRVKSINQMEVLLQLPEEFNPAQIPFVGGLYPSLEIRTMDYVGPNAGYFDLPPGTRFTPRQLSLLNEGVLDPALFSEAGQDPDVHRQLMRTFEALSLPGLDTNIRNRDDPFTGFVPEHAPGEPRRIRADFELGVSATITPLAGTPVAPLSKIFPLGVTPFRGGVGGVFKFDVLPTPPGVSRLVTMDEAARVRGEDRIAGANDRLPQSVTMFRLPPELQTGPAAERLSTLTVSIPSAAALPFAEGARTWTRHSQEALMTTLNALDDGNRGPDGRSADPALERALDRAYLVFGRDPADNGSRITAEQREALRAVIEAEFARARRLLLADDDGRFGAPLGGRPSP